MTLAVCEIGGRHGIFSGYVSCTCLSRDSPGRYDLKKLVTEHFRTIVSQELAVKTNVTEPDCEGLSNTCRRTYSFI